MQSPTVVHLPGPAGRTRQMVLRLDADAAIPLFEQLRAQLSVMVAVGRLEPGSRLPTVRYMATQLDLAPGTIARTYHELERDGVLEGRAVEAPSSSTSPPTPNPFRNAGNAPRRPHTDSPSSYGSWGWAPRPPERPSTRLSVNSRTPRWVPAPDTPAIR